MSLAYTAVIYLIIILPSSQFLNTNTQYRPTMGPNQKQLITENTCA